MGEYKGFEDYTGPDIDGALDWGDEIEHESDFVLLPPGEYPFEVVGFERARHPGSDKLPPCNKAVLTLKVYAQNGQTANVPYNLFLHRKTEGMLSEFFKGIGMKKKGEKIHMDWGNVIGKRGRLRLAHREYNGNTYHDVKRILEPKAQEPTAPQQATGFDGSW